MISTVDLAGDVPAYFALAGLFRAWALIGARLWSVPLLVPRVFYIASTALPEDPTSPAGTLGALRVQRTLPRRCDAAFVYQVILIQSTMLVQPLVITHPMWMRHRQETLS